jgi:hypothetical protein
MSYVRIAVIPKARMSNRLADEMSENNVRIYGRQNQTTCPVL